jgi:hypothetical protein
MLQRGVGPGADYIPRAPLHGRNPQDAGGYARETPFREISDPGLGPAQMIGKCPTSLRQTGNLISYYR